MITAIDVIPFETPIVVPFAISRETKETARLLVIRLTDDRGTVGLGEAAPFVSLTGDTLETAHAEALQLQTALAGLSMAQLRAKLYDLYGDSRQRSSTAVIGFEMALYDLEARRNGKALHQRFGQAARRSFTTDITLPILPPAAIERFWEHFRGYGFPVIKIKVSGNVTADLDMIETFFKIACPPGEPLPFTFSLDGNQGCDVQRSLQLVADLRKHGREPLFFEQPLPADDWQGLADLSRRSTIPICLDESVKSCADVTRARQLGAGSMINLKLMKAGLAETERIAQQAIRQGFRLMIGGMLESEIAMSCSLHLVAGSGAIGHLDLDTPFFFARHPTSQSPWHARRAELQVPSDPGLGLELALPPAT